jgi:hypothetical protein
MNTALSNNQDAIEEAFEANRVALESGQRQSRLALDASINASRTDQRAWVGPIRFVLQDMQAPNPIKATATIVNSGKTPALHVKVRYIIHASDGEIDIADYAKHPTETLVSGTPFSMFPNTPIELNADTGSTDELGIRSVNNGRKFLYMFGEIEYGDIFGREHQTRFCARYYWTTKQFAACGSYDHAD